MPTAGRPSRAASPEPTAGCARAGSAGSRRTGSCRLGLSTVLPEQRLLLDVVDTAVAPRVAAQQPPRCQHRTAEETVAAKRADRILRAARVVLARAGRRQQAEGPAPRVDEPDPQVPHVAAFPSTSATCSTSQACPRLSAGSARPWRATST